MPKGDNVPFFTVFLIRGLPLADLTDVTLVSEEAAHNSLQMSSSRDLTDVSEARDLTDVSEDAAHNYLQMSSSRDLTDVTLVSEDES